MSILSSDPFAPNGVVTRYGYDGRGMIQSVSHKNAEGQNLAFREYWRDNRDRILAWKRGPAGGPNGMEDGRGDRYDYDEEGQLEMADYRALNPETTTPQDPKRRDVFHYDQLGNRMGSANVIASWGPGPVSFSRENNGLNQYLSWTRSPINYDDDMGSDWGAPGQANGVTMQEGWITASYNALNQPKAIWSPSYPGGALAQYMWLGFDPLGRCVKRWMGSATGHAPGSNPATYYYYDGWNLIQEGPNGATADRLYVHGGGMDEIVASQAGGEWVYHHYDARGHCILLTKASDGAIREQYDYDAFGYPYFHRADGVKLGAAFQFGNRFLFTGREWLKDLRVYDYRNRIYQPELGRFLQPDPKQFEADDYNLYRYCHNDPINKVDPDGEWWFVLMAVAAYFIAADTADAPTHTSSPATRSDGTLKMATSIAAGPTKLLKWGGVGVKATGKGLLNAMTNKAVSPASPIKQIPKSAFDKVKDAAPKSKPPGIGPQKEPIPAPKPIPRPDE